MAAAGLNTVRTYSTPPVDVLELAEEAGLRLLVGLHYEDWRSVPQTRGQARRRILDAGRRALECAMERCAGRDSVLAVAVGNEVPADLVRLHGRSPKPALDAVAEWAERDLASLRTRWPAVSVLVCGYNVAAHIDRCLSSVVAGDYPALEVIYCDDGSTDESLALARRHPVKVIERPHQGLAATRNAGLKATSGEIVAYLDADAECHPEWLYHLALSLEDAEVAATGGPNLRFQDVGLVERAVAVAPGGPLHVLLTEDRAEHVPGCNMAVRRTALAEIGGFHKPLMAAGDDVDVCWRLLDRGHQIAFAPAAQVRHHTRPTLRAYLRQQRTYSASERMVCGRHTHRFNRLGQSGWAGFIYGFPRLLPGLLRPVVYQGTFGSAPYQGVLRRPAESVIPAHGPAAGPGSGPGRCVEAGSGDQRAGGSRGTR